MMADYSLRLINARDVYGSPVELFIESGRITDRTPRRARTLDAAGLTLAPGLVDIHVHYRDPWEGRDDEAGENLASGKRAALNGGVTTAACMPNTFPPIDTPELVQAIINRSAASGPGRVVPIAAITRGRQGREIVDFAELLRAGAVAFSDDGSTVMDPQIMEQALRASSELGFAVIAHALDETGSPGWIWNEGAARRLGVKGITPEAETAIVVRDTGMALRTGGRLHVAHVTTAGAVEAVRQAKQKGARVTCEVCPHHLALTEDDIDGTDSNYKMSPPLRAPADREALLAGLHDGTIDAIASDHAPHPPARKGTPASAACGITGVETMLPLVLETVVAAGVLTLAEAVDRMTAVPARILDLDAGRLLNGDRGDAVLFNPDAAWACLPSFFKSQSSNTPFTGRRLQGRIGYVICGGELISLD